MPTKPRLLAGMAGAVGLVALFALFSVSAFAQDATAQARWSNGRGDCADLGGEGSAGNGTGFISDFEVEVRVLLEGETLSVEFVDGEQTLFGGGKVSGALRDDGTFVLRGRYDVADEDYTYEGRIESGHFDGIFTRVAHFIGGTGGPRCTATWTVQFTAPGVDFKGGSRTQPSDADGGSSSWGYIALGALGVAAAFGGLWFFKTHPSSETDECSKARAAAKRARQQARKLRAKADRAAHAHDDAKAATEKAKREVDRPQPQSWAEDSPPGGTRWTTAAAKLKKAAQAKLTRAVTKGEITREQFDAENKRINTEAAHQEFEREAAGAGTEKAKKAQADLEKAQEEESLTSHEMLDNDAAASDAERVADAADAHAKRVCAAQFDDGLDPPKPKKKPTKTPTGTTTGPGDGIGDPPPLPGGQPKGPTTPLGGQK